MKGLGPSVLGAHPLGNAERTVRKTFPNGNVQFYEGSRGEERKVRKTFPDGTVEFFEGPQGQEQLMIE